MLSMLGKNFSRPHFEIFVSLFPKTGFGISCKVSPKETICMACQILFSGGGAGEEKNITNLS